MTDQGKGWHGDSEGHAEAARERNKTNWWPLLAIPLAFFVGMASTSAFDRNNNDQAQNYQSESGVGGAGYTPCVSPGMEQ